MHGGAYDDPGVYHGLILPDWIHPMAQTASRSAAKDFLYPLNIAFKNLLVKRCMHRVWEYKHGSRSPWPPLISWSNGIVYSPTRLACPSPS